MATYNTQMDRRNKRLIEVAKAMLMGDTQVQMSVKFKVSTVTIGKDVKVIKKRWLDECRETVGEFVSREGGRLDLAINAIMAKATAGKLPYIDRLCKLIETKMKVYGLDAKYVAGYLNEMRQGDNANSNETAGAISDGLRELEGLFDAGTSDGNGNGAKGEVPTIN